MDFLRGAAIVAVLLTHSLALFPRQPSETWFTEWIVLHLRACIAIFVFVSGCFFRVEGVTWSCLGSKYRRVQHAQARRHDFLADAVAGDDRQ